MTPPVYTWADVRRAFLREFIKNPFWAIYQVVYGLYLFVSGKGRTL